MTPDPTPATGERTTSKPPECREEHGAAFYDGTRPVGATGTHGTTGRRCRWDGVKWRIEAWDELHYTVMCALFEAYKAPDQHHGARGEKAGWSPDEIVTEHMRRYIARLGERTTSETTGAGLQLTEAERASVVPCEVFIASDGHTSVAVRTDDEVVAAVERIVAAARADERERCARAVEAAKVSAHIGSGFVPFGGGEPTWLGDGYYDHAARVIRAPDQNMPQDARGSDLTASQPSQAPVNPDAGDWACTCGDWHPPTQAACGRGEQITTVGEGWL